MNQPMPSQADTKAMPSSSDGQRRTVRSGAGQAGFTLVEIMAAILIIGLGLIVVAGSFDTFRTLSRSATKQETATQQAQRELERLRTLDWGQLEMNGTYASVANAKDPRSGISGTSYAPSADRPAEPLVIGDPPAAGDPETRLVDYQAGSWTEDGAKGKIYRFVTLASDTVCAGCPGQDYKRVTVAVTVDDALGAPQRFWAVSTLVTDPDSAKQTNLNTTPPPDPGDGTGATGVYYLTDRQLKNSSPFDPAPAVPSASHNVHDTPAKGGKRPDFLDTTVPAGTTDLLVSYTYRIAFQDSGQNYGLAAAISTVIFLMVAVVSLIQMRFTKIVEEEKR